jgi:hypothetical protein
MNTGIFIMLRVSMLFLLAFLWFLQPHRYGKLKSLLILACGFAFTIYPDVIIASHCEKYVSAYANYANIFEIFAVTGMAFAFGEHRDDRAVLAGLSASVYDLSGIVIGSIIYYNNHNAILSMTIQVVYYVSVLIVTTGRTQNSSLSNMLEKIEGRGKLCYIPALSYLAIYAAAAWPGNIFKDVNSRVFSLIMIVLMFTYYFLILSLLHTQQKSNRLARNNELLETYAASLERRIEQEKNSQEKMAVLRHDMRHRESMVLYYLDAGDNEAIRDLMTETGSRLDETVVKDYCTNAFLNMMLSDAAQKAEAKGIAFSCAVSDCELSASIRVDFAPVMLNLLENAQNAASQVPAEYKPFIKVEIFRKNSQLIVEISNSYVGELHYSHDSLLPISERGGEHGYGFRSVMAFSEKYNAPMDCQTDNGVFVFQIIIPDKK